MDIKELITYWEKSAKNDLETAKLLFKKGKYHWCLFISHLVIEKALKLDTQITN
jgi:HEPN domain-containing protein